jgi:hypothetical protein
MKKTYFFTVLTAILLTFNAYSTTYTSAANGNWMNFATWSPFGVPLPGDIVIINHAVVLDTSFAYSVGSITVNTSGSLTQSGSRDIMLNGINASFTNNGTTTIRYLALSAGSFNNTGMFNVKSVLNNITLNNSGTLNGVDSLYNNTGTVNNGGTINIMTFYNNNIWHNFGTIQGLTTVVDSMWNEGTFTNYNGAILKADSATNNGTFTNSGTIEYLQFTNYVNGTFANHGSLSFDDMTNFGIFFNYGTMNGTNSMWNNEVFNNINTGQITLGVSFLNADSVSNTANFINDGDVIIGDSYYNFNSITGSSTGGFTVQDSSYNSGTMTGSFDFCDQTPPPTYPKIDWNFGTLDATVTFCGLTSVAELDKSTFSVYPNPTEGIVNIGNQQQFVEVYSVDGKLLLQDSTNQINIKNYNSGMYFLVIKDQEGNQLYKEKLIKQ